MFVTNQAQVNLPRACAVCKLITIHTIVEQTLRSSHLVFKDLLKYFNSLDNEVINSQFLSSFKKVLKIKLLRKYENRS